MTVKEIFEVSSAIIASLGGGTVIVWSLSSWLGKVWANKILEKEKAKYASDLEKYKSQLEQEISKYEAITEKGLYISKAQYDNEYRIYLEIWSALYECVIFALALYPVIESLPNDEKEKETFQMKKYNIFLDAYNKYSTTINKYAPFYKDNFYDKFLELRNKCCEIGRIFRTEEWEIKHSLTYSAVKDNHFMSAEDKKLVYLELPNVINNLQSQLQKDIRDYLTKLRLEE